MGLDVYCRYGFGFLIEDEEKFNLLKQKIENEEDYPDTESFFKNTYPLPEGFTFLETDYEIVIIADVDDNKLMRREIPFPDYTPVLEWAEKYKVKFKSNLPEFHILCETCW